MRSGGTTWSMPLENLHVGRGQDALGDRESFGREDRDEVLEQRRDAVVVERRGRGAEHRHVLGLLPERLAVADELAADVAQRVLGAAALELVDRDDVGEVEHVDLLELRGGAELRRHDVHRRVDEGHDRGIALADAGGLDDHEVVAGGLEQVDDDRRGSRAARGCRGSRASGSRCGRRRASSCGCGRRAALRRRGDGSGRPR